MDPDVISLPFILRWFLVNILIVPKRKYSSAEAYKKIWTDEGSPLLTITQELCEKMGALSENVQVELAMRYGEPSIDSVIDRVRDYEEIVVVPMFPQYAEATTGSMLKKAKEVGERLGVLDKMSYLPDFHDKEFYVRSLAESLENYKDSDHILFSYHGLPEKLVKDHDPSGQHCLKKKICCNQMLEVNAKCYRAQCFATTRNVAQLAGLSKENFSISFQSRLGKAEWIKPYTDKVVQDLAKSGAKKVAVISPAFLIDCLETLEEVEIGLNEEFVENGGDKLSLVPCLNADSKWSQRFMDWLEGTNKQGWIS